MRTSENVFGMRAPMAAHEEFRETISLGNSPTHTSTSEPTDASTPMRAR